MNKQVLIAGGGIGGLASAIAAGRADWDVRLFERAAEFTEVGAGIQLGPNVVRRLQAWGLQRPLQRVVATPNALRACSAVTGKELGRLPLGLDMLQRYGASYATIHRADLHEILLQAAQNSSQVHLNLNQSVQSYTEQDGVLTISTSAGKLIEGDALIGADGVRSAVRAQMLSDGPPRVTGHLAYRAMVHQAQLPKRLRTNEVTAWLGPKLHAIQYPVRRGELQNLVVIVQGPAPADLEHWDHSVNLPDLLQHLNGTCSYLQDLVQHVPVLGGEWRLWPVADREPVACADQMARGLVALMGDAAHPMRPYLAQGAGMAIEDAVELQSALSMHDLDVSLRLRRYALNRWQRNARVQARSLRNGRIFHATGLVRWGRDLSMRALGGRIMDVPWLYENAL